MSDELDRMRRFLVGLGIHPERYAELDLGIGKRASRVEAKVLLKALAEYVVRADYLQHEINEMRRAMQSAGTWDAFCRDYAAYKDQH